jgi:hypothetical protein
VRESKIEGYLRAEIAKLGGTSEKFVSPGKRAVPDQLVSWGGYSLNGIFTHERDENGGYRPVVEFIETKAPGGELSVLQQRDHERRRAMGFQVHVIHTMALAEEYLRSRGKKARAADWRKPCCPNEKRDANGGCLSCGDPCI